MDHSKEDIKKLFNFLQKKYDSGKDIKEGENQLEFGLDAVEIDPKKANLVFSISEDHEFLRIVLFDKGDFENALVVSFRKKSADRLVKALSKEVKSMIE